MVLAYVARRWVLVTPSGHVAVTTIADLLRLPTREPFLFPFPHNISTVHHYPHSTDGTRGLSSIGLRNAFKYKGTKMV